MAVSLLRSGIGVKISSPSCIPERAGQTQAGQTSSGWRQLHCWEGEEAALHLPHPSKLFLPFLEKCASKHIFR